ncbi:RRP42 [Candida theae]|uniref:Ribosomal RNA-processing protein 42 n=1 Tax=Candida theae TaxID=1198502 RepID=A0AAD5BFQ4_9ASCO|nr:RRP42 [Candida theae]KAI5959436.1 RRP42 [Candida theae]
MLLSPAEKQYLHDSLSQSPVIRPDSRSAHQYRPLEATTSFLPGSNGSARIRLSEGSECIISVKAKVVPTELNAFEDVASLNLIDVDVDIAGYRDDSNYISNLKFQLTNLLHQNFPHLVLQLTTRYAFRLFIDCVIISHSSYPLSLMSLTTYLALKTTRLPLLVSDPNDLQVAEYPTFSDDWDDSRTIEEIMVDKKLGQAFKPPIFVTLGVVGKNLMFDPSVEEEQVLENGLVVSFYNDKVITPITNGNFALNSNNSNFTGLNKLVLVKSIALCNQYCPAIVKALDALVEQEVGESNLSIF